MGNEYGLKVLLPPRPQPAPGEGKTVKSWDRPAHEVLRYEEMRTAFREFAREVRKLDPFRPICTGESVPRPFAWHQERENTWVHSEVALAALWVFAYDRRPEYEVTASNERSYQLEAIMQANKKLREGRAPME